MKIKFDDNQELYYIVPTDSLRKTPTGMITHYLHTDGTIRELDEKTVYWKSRKAAENFLKKYEEN